MKHIQDMSYFPEDTPLGPDIIEKSKKQWGLKRTLLILVVLFVLWFFATGLFFVQFVSNGISGVSLLQSAKTEAYAFRFDSAAQLLQESEDAFAQAQRSFIVVGTLRVVPFVGGKIHQAGKLVRAGREATGALSSVLEIGQDVLKLAGLDENYLEQVDEGTAPHVSFSDLSSDTKKVILERFQASSKDLFIISKQIDVIQSELDDLSFDSLGLPFASALESIQSELSEAESILSRLSLLAHVLPQFSGLRDQQTYLILFLNDTELRPGGGFIGTYGVMNIKNGDLISLDTEDVYAIDDATREEITHKAPQPLQKYNNADQWFFRDGNWNPDFEESAKKLISQFEFASSSLNEQEKVSIANSTDLDGVIGFTTTFASDLLKITGPISVGSQTFTSKNVADKLEYQVEFAFVDQGIPVSQRKQILSVLVEKMVDQLFDLPLASWRDVLSVSEDSFKTKHLLLFHSDEAIQNVLASVGWGGVLEFETADVQLVVDANLASLKSDPVVKRTISYEIFENTSGDLFGRTKILYDHRGTFDWKTSRYRTYTRLFVPKGSKFARAIGSKENDKTQNPKNLPGPVDVTSEGEFSVFGTFTSVEPGQSQELIFEYELSKQVKKAIKKGVYDLSVFKQNGSANHTLTLDLNFDKNVSHAIPAEASSEWGDDAYRLNTKLDQDLVFEVRL